MVSVKGYLSSNFTKEFLIIFLPFFLIISLVYLVQISSLTYKIHISFSELLVLYGYSIPDIIFYTLPLSFIAALTNVLIKLSQGNELIALYALGLKAHNVLRTLLLLGLLFSMLLLAISFLAMPLSFQMMKELKTTKKSEAKLNISAGKLGQKFGDYYIYVKKSNEEAFEDIVIYNRNHEEIEQFFSSKSGKLHKTDGTISLLLNDGYGYTYSKEKLQQAQYKSLEVFDTTRSKAFTFEDITTYWAQIKTSERRLRNAVFYIFVSLIPLLSVYLVASFSMINPRYQANRSFLIIFLTAITLYLTASSLQKWGDFYMLPVAIIGFFILGKWLFQKRVVKYF